MQDPLPLTPRGSDRLGCSWVKLWSGLTLAPMWQRAGAWLRGSCAGGPPYWHRSRSPTMTTSLSWWWHASLWSQQPPTWPQKPHCLSLSGVCGVEGENQSDYWETCENNWVHVQCWWRKVPITSCEAFLMVMFEQWWKMCVLMFTFNRWRMSQKLLEMSWLPIF